MILVPEPDMKAATLMGRPVSFGSKRGIRGISFIQEKLFEVWVCRRIPPFSSVMPLRSELK